jgi:hypothetical protein
MDNQDHDASTLIESSKNPELEVISGENIGETFAVKRRTRIGRERDNDIILLDPKVSRYHAQISLEADRWMVTDLGSSNRTYVNGQAITAAIRLHSGDRVGIGETELRFSLPDAPATETAPVIAAPVSAAEPVAPVSATPGTRSAPPRLAWLAGGFVLLLCLAAVIVIYMISQTTGPDEGAATVVVSPAIEDGGLAESAEVVKPPENLALIYEDDFSDSFGGWDDAFDDFTTKQYGNNRYQIEVSTDNLIAWGLANRDVADFELEVEARQEDGAKSNSYGLLFRLQDRDNFYRFDISGDGFFLVSKFLDGQWYTLVDWTQSPYLNSDANNILKVSAFGPNITVWANGQSLASITDDSFTHGNFGFFASTFSEPHIWVSFDNLKVWAPEGQQITMLPTATPPRAAPTPTPSPPLPPTNTPAPVSDTIALSPLATPEEEATEEATSTPSPIPTVTSTPTSEPTSTPVPLPEYASRDQPLARGETQVTGRIVFPVFDPGRGIYDIYIANAADGNNRELVQQEASQPALSIKTAQKLPTARGSPTTAVFLPAR